MNDAETRIQEIKEKVAEFTAQRNWTSLHSPKNLAMSIAVEAAELMEIFQWMTVEDSWHIAETDEFTHVKEELADILIYCCSFASQLNIDVAAAIEDKMEKNAKRFPSCTEVKDRQEAAL